MCLKNVLNAFVETATPIPNLPRDAAFIRLPIMCLTDVEFSISIATRHLAFLLASKASDQLACALSTYSSFKNSCKFRTWSSRQYFNNEEYGDPAASMLSYTRTK